jgi:hypothetical protein
MMPTRSARISRRSVRNVSQPHAWAWSSSIDDAVVAVVDSRRVAHGLRGLALAVDEAVARVPGELVRGGGVFGIRVRQQAAEGGVVGLAEQQHRVDLVGEVRQQHRLFGLEHEANALAPTATRDDHVSALDTVACRP